VTGRPGAHTVRFAARRLLDGADPATASGWPRAPALLARQALKDALASLVRPMRRLVDVVG